MSIPGFSVRNPIVVNLIMWGIIIGGVVSWNTLVREFFPTMEPDVISVTVAWPGATPEEVEKGVARPVERAVDSLEGVKEVSTRVLEGRSVTRVEFHRGTDLDEAINDVRSAIDIVKPDLPTPASPSRSSPCR
ncbi:MAG: efflux RND transporter permease subunit [Planctomycetota bacterium]|jgi:HAE1 family hydrophobic/amphiphilic exporter-1